MELDCFSDSDLIAHGEGARPLVGAEHVAHEEVASVELGLVLVDDPPDVKADLHRLAVDLIGGPWVYRLLISGGKLPEVGPESLVDLVLSGIASP